jgi:hypothetical protein
VRGRNCPGAEAQHHRHHASNTERRMPGCFVANNALYILPVNTSGCIFAAFMHFYIVLITLSDRTRKGAPNFQSGT